MVGSGVEKGRVKTPTGTQPLLPSTTPSLNPTPQRHPEPPSAPQADAHILFKCHISFDPGQRFSMCLAQLLHSQQPPPLTPFVYFPGEPPPSS